MARKGRKIPDSVDLTPSCTFCSVRFLSAVLANAGSCAFIITPSRLWKHCDKKRNDYDPMDG